MTPESTQHQGSFSDQELEKIRQYFTQNLMRKLDSRPQKGVVTRDDLVVYLEEIFQESDLKVSDGFKKDLFKEVIDEVQGFGPIQPLLDDPSITEVMVNDPDQVYIEREGKIQRTEISFEDDDHITRVIEKIVLPLGRRIDEERPTVDARLPDGSRVNAVIPPVAIDGPLITIRKFSEEKLTVQDLVEYGSITKPVAEFCEACVKARLNIIISGGTGSGKTTLLNIFSGFIPEGERIVTIEDSAELQLHQTHVVRLETKPPNIEDRNEVDIRHLVRNSLRMRPDRIVVGEVRGGEALDMLQAMNTGHDGSLTTLHANSPRDALSRLETLVMMSGMELPVRVIREQIASAVDVIVQQARFSDGSRKVTHVTEVAGMEGDTIVMTDVFKFNQTGVRDGEILGQIQPTGIRPMFGEHLESAGYELSPELFTASF